MGMCVRYMSASRQEMVTDFVGIVEVISCTGKDLAAAKLEYLKKIGLLLSQFYAVGTDGAPNMCGQGPDSMYTHLKKEVSHLQIVQCVCHTLHKCAEYSFRKLPDELSFFMSETNNYFAHSSKRWDQYTQYYKEKNPEKPKPNKLVTLAMTRWLIWLPASSRILDDWTELRGFFNRQARAGDHKVQCLAVLYNNNCNLLYLTFLRTILRDVQAVNLAFECENPDVTKIYSDLRNLLFTASKRVLHPRAVANASRPGMLRSDEVEMLKEAFKFKINYLPVDCMNFGDSFKQLSQTVQLAEGDLATVQQKCAEFLIALSEQLIQRVPRNLESISKIRNLAPRVVLARVARPNLDQLPIELAGPSLNRDLLHSQWTALGEVSLPDVCPHLDRHENLDDMDMIHFWACVSSCKDGSGRRPFKELAAFVLRVLTLPISNATVERVFSVLSCIKTKRRNRLQLKMLDSILRLRVHLKIDGLCCISFKPTKDMLGLFNATKYSAANDLRGPLLAEEVVGATGVEVLGAVGGDQGEEIGASRNEEAKDLEEEDYAHL